MKRPKFEALAIKLTKELNSYKNTIPGMIELHFSSLLTKDDKVVLHLKSREFMDSFTTVDEIDPLKSGGYLVTVKVGEMAIVAVFDQDEIKKYVSAEPSASTRPALTLC